jgi:ribosomal protein S20
MPIIKSAQKRMRQALKRRERNVELKKNIKIALKELKANPSAENASKVQSAIDTAVKKNLLKKATGSRRKAAVSKLAKEAGVKLVTKKEETKKAPAKKTATKKTTKKVEK